MLLMPLCHHSAIGIGGPVKISLFGTVYQRHNPNSNRTPSRRKQYGPRLEDIRTIRFFGVRVEKIKKSLAVQ